MREYIYYYTPNEPFYSIYGNDPIISEWEVLRVEREVETQKGISGRVLDFLLQKNRMGCTNINVPPLSSGCHS